MTSTASPIFPSYITDPGPDVPMHELVAEAEKLGAEAGRGVAGWMRIESESGARRLLELDGAGDPLLDEYGPAAPFVEEDLARMEDMTEERLISGQEGLYLDPDSVAPDERAAIIEAYVFAYRQAYWDDVLARCSEFVVDCRAEDRAEAESQELADQG